MIPGESYVLGQFVHVWVDFVYFLSQSLMQSCSQGAPEFCTLASSFECWDHRHGPPGCAHQTWDLVNVRQTVLR